MADDSDDSDSSDGCPDWSIEEKTTFHVMDTVFTFESTNGRRMLEQLHRGGVGRGRRGAGNSIPHEEWATIKDYHSAAIQCAQGGEYDGPPGWDTIIREPQTQTELDARASFIAIIESTAEELGIDNFRLKHRPRKGPRDTRRRVRRDLAKEGDADYKPSHASPPPRRKNTSDHRRRKPIGSSSEDEETEEHISAENLPPSRVRTQKRAGKKRRASPRSSSGESNIIVRPAARAPELNRRPTQLPRIRTQLLQRTGNMQDQSQPAAAASVIRSPAAAMRAPDRYERSANPVGLLSYTGNAPSPPLYRPAQQTRQSQYLAQPEAPRYAPPGRTPFPYSSTRTDNLDRFQVQNPGASSRSLQYTAAQPRQPQSWVQGTDSQLRPHTPRQPRFWEHDVDNNQVHPFSPLTGQRRAHGADNLQRQYPPALPPLHSMMRATSTLVARSQAEPIVARPLVESSSGMSSLQQRGDPMQASPNTFAAGSMTAERTGVQGARVPAVRLLTRRQFQRMEGLLAWSEGHGLLPQAQPEPRSSAARATPSFYPVGSIALDQRMGTTRRGWVVTRTGIEAKVMSRKKFRRRHSAPDFVSPFDLA